MPSHDHADHDAHHEHLDAAVDERDDWARRRRKGIPTDENLLVVACMDERIPIEEALGIDLGDAQVFRNAGGKVTDDVIRSAALTTNFFDTDEIVVINHTDCGMMRHRRGLRRADRVPPRVGVHSGRHHCLRLRLRGRVRRAPPPRRADRRGDQRAAGLTPATTRRPPTHRQSRAEV